MRVLFLQDVANVAKAGDIKEVANGYAKNHLFPRKLVTLATSEELKRISSIKQAAETKKIKDVAEIQTLGEKISGISLVINSKASNAGKLYGSVSAGTIAHNLSKVIGVEIDKEFVELKETFKEVGEYTVTIKLAQDIMPTIELSIKSEDEQSDDEEDNVTNPSEEPADESSTSIESDDSATDKPIESSEDTETAD